MDSLLDDCGDPVGRRMVVVFAGGNFAFVRRTAEVCCGEHGDIGCHGWRRSLQAAEKVESPAAALPARTALLVKSFAARQVFLSIRAYHDGVFHRSGDQLLLSRGRT